MTRQTTKPQTKENEMIYTIGIANPAPSMTVDFRTFEGSKEAAIELAKTFHEIEERTVTVASGRHFVGYAKKPFLTLE
jgi:hypothetical protein